MLRCPNADCPHLLRVRSPATFRAGFERCPDCGASLVDAVDPRFETPARVPGFVDDAPIPRSAWRALAVTVACAAVFQAFAFIPLPGLDAELFGKYIGSGGFFASLSVGALGVSPYVTGFVVVECVAWLVPAWRTSRATRAGRARLLQASVVVSLLSACAQAAMLTSWLQGIDATVGELLNPGVPVFVLGLSLVAGTALAVPLGTVLHRFGVGGSLSVLLLSGVARSLFDAATRFAQERVPWSDLLGPLLVIGGSILLGLLLVRPRLEEAPALPWPSTGLVPLQVAALPVAALALVPLVASRLDLAPIEGLERLAERAPYAQAALLLPSTLLCAWLYMPTRRFVDATTTLEEGKRAWRNALAPTLALLMGVLVASLFAQRFGLHGELPATLVAATAIVRDVVVELRAHAQLGATVYVHEVHRTDTAARVVAKLREHGIEAAVRGAHHRALLCFFGPYVPVGILVPVTLVDEARTLLVDEPTL